jgi:hypothetical protein
MQVFKLFFPVFDITGFKLLLAVDLGLHPVEAVHMLGYGIPCNRVSGYRVSGLHGSLHSMSCNDQCCTYGRFWNIKTRRGFIGSGMKCSEEEAEAGFVITGMFHPWNTG